MEPFIDVPTFFEFELIGISSVLKVLMLILIIGYVFYAIMLLLRVRILMDTVNTRFNTVVRTMTLMHLFIAMVGSFVVLALTVLI